MDAESVHIYSSEDGFWLAIEASDGDVHEWRVQNIAEELYDTVKREIGPWLYERDMARASYDAAIPGDDELDDPKSEGYHDRMSAIHDNREGK